MQPGPHCKLLGGAEKWIFVCAGEFNKAVHILRGKVRYRITLLTRHDQAATTMSSNPFICCMEMAAKLRLA